MKDLSFRQQASLGLGAAIVLWTAAFLFHLPWLMNLSWIFYGALFALHPVSPGHYAGSPRAAAVVRLAGVLCIAVGLFSRFGTGA